MVRAFNRRDCFPFEIIDRAFCLSTFMHRRWVIRYSLSQLMEDQNGDLLRSLRTRVCLLQKFQGLLEIVVMGATKVFEEGFLGVLGLLIVMKSIFGQLRIIL